jgi:hypothetical protein
MAKGQMRGNREIKKPKQKKEPVAAPGSLAKGITPPGTNPKKKG